MDETGIANSIGDNGLVMGFKSRKLLQKKKSGDRIWTTILECVSADGWFLNLLVIFKGRSLQ